MESRSARRRTGSLTVGFGQFLWTLRSIVAEHRFEEAGEETYLLKKMAGRDLLQPVNRHFLPDQECLAWHRRHHKFEDG